MTEIQPDILKLEEAISKFVLEPLNEDDISSILLTWEKVNKMTKILEQLDERLRFKIKNFMKERRWDRYNDNDSKINVSLIKMETKSLDKDMLKLMLSEQQLTQVTNVTVSERLSLTTPEMRETLKKNIRALDKKK